MPEENDIPENGKENERSNSLRDSVKFVVDMMNEGTPDVRDVYPRGRYQGD